jgi:hypothetical protein
VRKLKVRSEVRREMMVSEVTGTGYTGRGYTPGYTKKACFFGMAGCNTASVTAGVTEKSRVDAILMQWKVLPRIWSGKHDTDHQGLH